MIKVKSTVRAHPVLMGVLGFLLASSIAWAGISNFGSLTLSDNLIVTGTTTLTGATTFGTAITSATITTLTATTVIAGSDTLPPYATATFYLGDTLLGMDADAGAYVGVWNPHTAVTVVGMDFFGTSVIAGDTVGDGSPEIFFRDEDGGIYSDTITVTRGVVVWPLQTTFRWDIAANSTCTLFVRDAGADATGQEYAGAILHVKYVDQ